MSSRNELGKEFGIRFTWLVRNDRKMLFIGLLKLVNAVWFAGLWQTGFAIGLSLLLWVVFFIASMLIAIRLDRL